MKFLPDNRVIALGTLAGVILTAASFFVGGIVYTVRLRDDATASRASDVDHETRLRLIENGVADMRADVRETKTDVSWIRSFLAHKPVPDKEPATTASN